MPVISGLTYTKTDTTIVAVWTTDVSADSNLFAGSKAAIDNGVAASGTSHQCIVTGLLPSTTYACHVVSGGTSSSVSNVTTNALQTRVLVTSASNGAVTLGSTANTEGDTFRTFVSSDGNTYVTQDDGFGIQLGSHNAGFAMQCSQITTPATMTGNATLLTNYGAFAETDGTDGPGGVAMTNKSCGIFGLNANLYVFAYRQDGATASRYCNAIKTQNHGSTWNNFTNTSSYVAGGVQVSPHSPAQPVQFSPLTAGLVVPIRYAADDGTLGYNTAGNQIDGGNAFVYFNVSDIENSVGPYLMRIPRITFDAQTLTGTQYWFGPTNPVPLQFTNDANWQSSPTGATRIWTGSPQVVNPTVGNSFPFGSDWIDITFIPAFNSYVLMQDTYGNLQFQFYSAPTPAGPWHLFYTQDNGGLVKNWYGPFLYHADVVANSVTSNATMKFLYAGNSGQAQYCINYSTLTLNPTTPAMVQVASCAFLTVENPLSFGGNFSTSSSYSALQVSGTGVCEATATSTNCLMHWSGAVPQNDTGGVWPNDQYSQLVIGALAALGSDNCYLTVRQAAAAHTCYILVLQRVSTTQTFAAFVAGTFHSLATFTATVAANDTWKLQVVGTVLTAYQNGLSVGTFTDSSNFVPGPGAPGFGLSAATLANTTIIGWGGGANQAAAPTFSPTGGNYTSSQTVTLTGPASSTIYYTLNGTTPTRSSPSLATGSTITITSTQTLMAMSSVSNFADSQVTTTTYTLGGAVKTTHQQLRNWREGRR